MADNETESSGAIPMNDENLAKAARKPKVWAIFWLLVGVIAFFLFIRNTVFEKDKDDSSNIIEATTKAIAVSIQDEEDAATRNLNVDTEATPVSDLEIFNYSNDAPPAPVVDEGQSFIITDISEEAPPKLIEDETKVAIDEEIGNDDLSPEERKRRAAEAFENKKDDVLAKRGGSAQNSLASDLLIAGRADNDGLVGDNKRHVEDPLANAKINFVTRYYNAVRPTGLSSAGAGLYSPDNQPTQGTGNANNNEDSAENSLLDDLLNNNNPPPDIEIPNQPPPEGLGNPNQAAYDFINNIEGQLKFQNQGINQDVLSQSRVIKPGSPFLLNQGKIIPVRVDRRLTLMSRGQPPG